MGKGITYDTWMLWEMLLKDGGWWSAKGLVGHWQPTFAPHEVQHALDALEAGSFLSSRDQLGTRIYAVTTDCNLLPERKPAAQPGALA